MRMPFFLNAAQKSDGETLRRLMDRLDACAHDLLVDGGVFHPGPVRADPQAMWRRLAGNENAIGFRASKSPVLGPDQIVRAEGDAMVTEFLLYEEPMPDSLFPDEGEPRADGWYRAL